MLRIRVHLWRGFRAQIRRTNSEIVEKLDDQLFSAIPGYGTKHLGRDIPSAFPPPSGPSSGICAA